MMTPDRTPAGRTGGGRRARGTMLAMAMLVAAGLWIAGSAASVPAQAAQAAPAAPASEDPATLARVKSLENELRCLVCQAQSIAESDSDFAHDVRREINRMIEEERSDREIKSFLVERYGDFILY